ncbi:MAG: response regulator [Desulfobacterales bacterium]
MAVNVLIVDDSGVMRAMIRKAIELSGLSLGEVHQAENGRAGLEILESSWIDLVLVDINMPVMNGEEMIAAMHAREDFRSIPTVVVSTEGSRSRIERLETSGVRFIHKPFSPEKLRDTLRDLLGSEVFHA